MQTVQQYKVGDEIASSSGGTIRFTATGLIHSAGRRYAGDLEAEDTGLDGEGQPVVKRGRGRPRKDEKFRGV